MALLLLAAACGDESNPSDAEPGNVTDDGAVLTTYEPCPIEEDVGEFIVELAEDYTNVRGQVKDGVVPEDVPAELASEGSCRLVTPPQLNCDPRCPFSTETCAMGNVCVPLPQARNVGTVTVSGLVAPVTLTPNDQTNGYTTGRPISHPGFEPGAHITLSTTGGDYDPITLRGWGVSLFELTEPVRVDPGAATALRWAVPAEPGPAHVTVRLDINLHGSSKAWIECDFPDTGSAEIPAPLIDGLIAQGLSGFPTIAVTRRTASSARIEPGCVELLVISQLETPVTVAGLTSCDEETPCPEGQTCRAVELVCE